jgi:hypothetical protein
MDNTKRKKGRLQQKMGWRKRKEGERKLLQYFFARLFISAHNCFLGKYFLYSITLIIFFQTSFIQFFRRFYFLNPMRTCQKQNSEFKDPGASGLDLVVIVIIIGLMGGLSNSFIVWEDGLCSHSLFGHVV